METNIRVGVSGVSEAEQQLRNFGKAVSDLSRNAQQNVGGGGALNLDSIINQITQKVGGIDPFRSGRDYGKFSRELQQSYIAPAEQRKSLASGELKNIDSYRQTISQQLSKGDISEEEYNSTIKELNKETEFYNTELNKVTDSLKRFNDILSEVGKMNQEILSGERDASEAPKGTRGLGTLEELGLQRARTEYKIQRESNVAERNKLASDSRENLKQVIDLRSDKILTTNQRAVYNPAFQGASNVVGAIGGGVGGAFGEIVDTTINFAKDVREMFTLDIPKILGGGLTAMANLTASYSRMTIPKMVELQTSQSETGRIGGVVSEGAYGLGMNASETNRALQGTYRSLGVGNAGLGVGAMQLESGAGVGVGGLSELFQNFKYYSKENQNVLGEVGKAVSILSESGIVKFDPKTLIGDFSRMQEATRLIGQVDSMQSGRFQNVDVTTSASVVAGLEKLGGTFRGNAGMGKFNKIDEGIRNPENDFIKATVFRALMAENPNMDMADLEERMQGGALGEGNFGAVMKQVGMQSGVDTENATKEELLGNKMFLRNVAKVFTGGQIADARALIEGGRTEGTGAFDIFDKKQGDNISGALMGRGSNAPKIVQKNKELDDFLANQDGKVAETMIEQTLSALKFISNMAKNLGDTFGKLTEEANKWLANPVPDENIKNDNDLLDKNINELKTLNGNINGLNKTLEKSMPNINQLKTGVKGQ